MTTDFKAIRDENPLPQVMQAAGVALKQAGSEFRCVCPFHDDHDPSMSVYRNKRGTWKCHCFVCHAHCDTIDFVDTYYALGGKAKAAEYLTGVIKPDLVPYTPPPSPAKASPFIKPPATAPAIVAGERTPRLWNPKRDKHTTYTPKAVFPYTDKTGALIGYVLRVEFDDRKITPFIGWTKDEGWSHGSMPAPRPLYRLKALYDNPDAAVLVVEGEKCADFAALRLRDENIVAVAWMGGTGAVAQTHWKSLQGRRVYIWPDHDDVGRKAAGEVRAGLEGVAAEIHTLQTEGMQRPSGWDVADFGDSSQKTLEDFVFGFGVDVSEHDTPAPAATAITPADADIILAAQDEREIVYTNRQAYMVSGETGDPVKTSVMNVQLILQFSEKYAGIFGWDDFSKCVVVLRRPPWQSGWKGVRASTDDDMVHCRAFLDHERLNVKLNDLGGIVAAISKDHTVNPVLDALHALKWDGIPRLAGGLTGFGDSVAPWLTEYMEADDTPVNRMFGLKWMIAAVARVIEPGCKVDTILVLESPQGVKKSTAIRVLADGLLPGYFTDEVDKPGSKDAGLQLQGKWHIELGELSAMSRASVEEVKAWVTRRADRFRPPFGKLPIEYPRACIFSATHNPLGEMGYLKDPTGARRFWPVAVRFIDLPRLKDDAAQLWAEAVHRYKAGENWWTAEPDEVEMAESAQKLRFEHDPYMDAINEIVAGKNRISIGQIMNGLCIPVERQSNLTSRRISSAMSFMGWEAAKHEGRIVFDKV